MNKPLISVIVPTYNRPQLLRRTLASILDQSYKSIETIVINDCGDKEAKKVVDSFSGSENFGVGFKYFENEENKGLAETRNVGMEKAKGDYFIFLDDDDILLPLAIDFRIHMMQKFNAEIVYTRALQDIWEKTKEGYKSVHKQLYWDSSFDKDLILIQNIAPCCCPMFSRKAWDDSGNYKLDIELDTGEDYDFWIALSRENNFEELKLIDAECSIRKDLTQMTGSKDFGKSYPIIYKRWRDTANNYEWVKEHQNNVLKNMNYNPEDYGL